MIQIPPPQVERTSLDHELNTVSSVAPHAELLRTHRPDPHRVTRVVSARVTLPEGTECASPVQLLKTALSQKTRP